MQPDHPIIGDLVLVGGGHAQVALLKSLAMNPVPGLRTTLICREVDTPYSGMLPGFVEGVWSQQDIHIDLARLAAPVATQTLHGRDRRRIARRRIPARRRRVRRRSRRGGE